MTDCHYWLTGPRLFLPRPRRHLLKKEGAAVTAGFPTGAEPDFILQVRDCAWDCILRHPGASLASFTPETPI